MWTIPTRDACSARRRRSLARSLSGAVRSLDSGRLPGASPLNRAGLAPYAAQLEALATRIADLERPASRLGLDLVHNLLTDGGSPLYDRDRAHEVPSTVRNITRALNVR
jgi:hypothetical protein